MTISADQRLECVVTETGPGPEHAVIWLHGLGADGNDFAPIVPQLACSRTRPVRFVFPHAPVRPITINGGMAMRAWYDIRGVEIARDQDREGIQRSLEQVDALIEHELAQGIAPESLLLAGFSQGGAIALRSGLARRRSLAGVIGVSCSLLESDSVDGWLTEAGRDTAVFLGHGSQDPVVPVALGREAARVLAQRHLGVEWGEWPMQHAVCPEEIAALDAWMDGRFAA